MSRRSCMASSQQKNHPNERMNATTVVCPGEVSMRVARSTSSPVVAWWTTHPLSAAYGSAGASGGVSLREDVAMDAVPGAARVRTLDCRCRSLRETEGKGRERRRSADRSQPRGHVAREA